MWSDTARYLLRFAATVGSASLYKGRAKFRVAGASDTRTLVRPGAALKVTKPA